MEKIWMLNHYAISPELGPLTRHYKFAENLIKKGYAVKIFAASTLHYSHENLIKDSSKYIYKKFNDVPFVFVRASDYKGNGKKRILNMFQYAYRILLVSKEFDSEKPDVVYASSAHPLTWLAGYKLAKRYNAKFIAETRDLWPETLVAMGKMSRNSIPTRILYKIEKYIYKKADKLIFTFPGGKDYVESIGLDTSKARYINNGVDLEEYNRNKIENIYEDKNLEDKHTFKVVYTGAIGKYNGVNYLIEAGNIIKKKGYSDIKILIWGNGTEKNMLQEYANKNGIDNVIFKNSVEKKYIPNILSKSDVNLLLGLKLDINKYGLSPNKLFDYFASGRPVISNRKLKEQYDLVKKYDCGISIEDESSEALANGIIEFYNITKEERYKFSKNALIAAKDFDFKLLTNKLENIILED